MPNTSEGLTRPQYPKNLQEINPLLKVLLVRIDEMEANMSTLDQRITQLEECIKLNHGNSPDPISPTKAPTVSRLIHSILGEHPAKLLHYLIQDSLLLVGVTIIFIIFTHVLKLLFDIGGDEVIHFGNFTLSSEGIRKFISIFHMIAMITAVLALFARWIVFLIRWFKMGIGMRT